MGSAAFGRPYSGDRCCFLFLRVLGCFLSPRSRSHTGAPPKGQDCPFGDPGFYGSLRLPRAFRSLARPSSAPEPSHPPAGISRGSRSQCTPGDEPLHGFTCPNLGHQPFPDDFHRRVHVIMDSSGFEPEASALQRRRSTRLSYEPMGLPAIGPGGRENRSVRR